MSLVNMDDMKRKAKDVVEQQGEKLEGVVEKGRDLAKDRFSGHADKIDTVADKAKDLLGRNKPAPPPQ